MALRNRCAIVDTPRESALTDGTHLGRDARAAAAQQKDRSNHMSLARKHEPRLAKPRPRPRRWLARLAWALALAIVVVVLLPYLLVPLYRTLNPISTLML